MHLPPFAAVSTRDGPYPLSNHLAKSKLARVNGAMTKAPGGLPDPEYLPEQSLADRVDRGRHLQQRVPLDGHATSQVSDRRIDPVETLERQAVTRDPELVPLRHGRMSVSPFAFYRGGAAIMAADLVGAPQAGLNVQLCGDAHLLNFGIYRTPERSLVFGLNDFDETLPGPFEWDVKRLAVSVEIAGRELRHAPGTRRQAVEATVRAYRSWMNEFASMRNLELWRQRLPTKKLRKHLEQRAGSGPGEEADEEIRKALRRNHLSAFDKLVKMDGDEIRFAHRPPLLVPVEELLDGEARDRYEAVVGDFLRRFRGSVAPDKRALLESYRFMHGARKVGGVGSVGNRTWVVLMMGRDAKDPLILQLKEAQRSVLEPYAGPSRYRIHGRRVVEGQRLLQSASDEFLGYLRNRALDGRIRDYYVRQLWDGKASIEVADLDPPGLRAYGEMCARALALGHARSGDRVAIAAYLGDDGRFDRAIGEYAASYADLNEADFEQLLDAIETGRLPASDEV